MKRRLTAPSPALIISLIALFVALGGTAYATTSLPKNSVGTKQLKKNAVTTAKIKRQAVTAAKINTNGLTVPNATHAISAVSATSATNATNASHATTADSATSATNATNATNASHATSADSATSASSPGLLGSGETETGVVHAIAPEASGAAYLGTAISFPFPLASAPAAHYITSGSTVQCPGSVGNPTATSGNLCVYQDNVSNSGGAVAFEFVTKWGAGIYMPTPAGSSYSGFQATWAVTG